MPLLSLPKAFSEFTQSLIAVASGEWLVAGE